MYRILNHEYFNIKLKLIKIMIRHNFKPCYIILRIRKRVKKIRSDKMGIDLNLKFDEISGIKDRIFDFFSVSFLLNKSIYLMIRIKI
jgi:hypothetical protein